MLGIDATIQGRAAEDCLGRDHAYRLEPKTAAVADRLARMLAFVVRGPSELERGLAASPDRADSQRVAAGAGKHLRPTAAPVQKTGDWEDPDGPDRPWRRKSGNPTPNRRGHLTLMGLFKSIAEYPDEVIVLDDPRAVLKSDVALQILLSALEHPTGRDRGRVVKYRRQGRE